MAERDLVHVTPGMLQEVAERPHRVIVPVASLHSVDGQQALGVDIVRVEAAASGIRAELNASAPELATWWTTPTIWQGPSPSSEPGSVGLEPNHYTALLHGTIQALLDWAEAVIVVVARDDVPAVPEVVTSVRETGANVVWISVEQGPDAIYDAADALRFQQPGPDGQVHTSPSTRPE